jgi:PAS domain S-box-containing protein
MDRIAIENGNNTFEWTIRNFEGTPLRAEVSLTIIPYQAKNVLLVHLNDLTAKKQIEQLLRTEDEHRLLLKFSENVPGAIYQLKILENKGISFPFISSGIYDIIGLTVREIKENPMAVFERIHESDRDMVASSFLEAYFNLQIWEYDCRVNLPSGGIIWMHGSARPEKVEDGAIVWNGYVNDITDKKLAEQLLKENEAQFRDILNNTDELIQNIRLEDGMILYTNPAWQKTLGYSEAEAKQLNFLDIIHPDNRDHCMELFKQVKQGVSDVSIEAVFISKTGQQIYLEGQTGCFIKEGVPFSTRGLFRNVTEIKKSADIINKEKELSNSIMNNLPGIFYLFDSSGRFLRWNKNFESITGYSAEEIARMVPTDFFEAEEAEKLERRYQTGTNNNLGGIEFNLLTKQKTLVPIFLNSMGIHYEGKLCRLGMGINISERKKAEVLLLRNQLLFEEAQELAHIGSWEYNFITTELIWSKEMFRVFDLEGLPVQELVTGYKKRIHPEDLQRFEGVLQQLLDKGEIHSIECRLISENGVVKYVHAIGEPIKSKRQQIVIGLRGTVQDITSIKLAEQMLQASKAALDKQQQLLIHTNSVLEEKARLLQENNKNLQDAHIALDKKAEELATASRYKSEFLANMSHELRTPLNSIMILSKLLQKNKSENLTAKQVEFAGVIQKSGTDLLHLINEVLDLSKIESGKIDLEITENSLPAFVHDMELAFKGIALEKEIKFSVKLEKSIPEMFITDFGKLGQVIKNLLSNAFKFTPNKGKVQLILRQRLAQLDNSNETPLPVKAIEFLVKDNGIGIPADKQDMVFMAFQQADGTTQRRYGGTGLGLSISRELARLLGGEISLQSAEDKGATFSLKIPVELKSIRIKEG